MALGPWARAAAAAVLLALAPVWGWAQDGPDTLATAYDRIPPGTRYHFETDSGDIWRFTIQGKGPEGWVETWESVVPDMPGRSSRRVIDEAGSILRRELNQGDEVYPEGNCRRIVGTCDYHETGWRGDRRYRQVLTPTAEGFRTRLYRIEDGGTLTFVRSTEVWLDGDRVSLRVETTWANGSQSAYWRIEQNIS